MQRMQSAPGGSRRRRKGKTRLSDMPTDVLSKLYEFVEVPLFLKLTCTALRKAAPVDKNGKYLKTETKMSQVVNQDDISGRMHKYALSVHAPWPKEKVMACFDSRRVLMSHNKETWKAPGWVIDVFCDERFGPLSK
jgi:hypothetical protein